MNKHLTERQLEEYLRSGDSLSRRELEQISEHLDSCQLCSDHLKKLKAYLDDLDNHLSRQPTNREKALASKIYNEHIEKYLPSNALITKSFEQSVEKKHTNQSTAISYIRQYPLPVITIAAASALVALILLFVRPWQPETPSFAKVEKNTLRVFNTNSNIIWKMPANGIPEGISSQKTHPKRLRQYITLMDLNGNAKKELLVTGNNHQNRFASDSLYCFKEDGNLWWKQGIPHHPAFFSQKNRSIGWWDIIDFFKFDSGNKKSHLFAFANAGRWSPSVFYELDPGNGKILQRYWQTGQLQTAISFKIGDSRKILLGGINDTYNKASLAVLDPDKIDGRAPGRKLFQTGAFSNTPAEQYITFSPSILSQKYSSTPYNQVTEIFHTDNGNIIIHTKELLRRLDTNLDASVYYLLDKNFSVLDVYGDDNFEKLYSQLYQEGKLKQPLNDYYKQKLENGVRYWDGEKFVQRPVKLR